MQRSDSLPNDTHGTRSRRTGCRLLPTAGLAALCVGLGVGAEAVASGAPVTASATSDPGRPNGGFAVEESVSSLSNPNRPNGGFLTSRASYGETANGGNGGFLFGNGGDGGAGDAAGCDGSD